MEGGREGGGMEKERRIEGWSVLLQTTHLLSITSDIQVLSSYPPLPPPSLQRSSACKPQQSPAWRERLVAALMV